MRRVCGVLVLNHKVIEFVNLKRKIKHKLSQTMKQILKRNTQLLRVMVNVSFRASNANKRSAAVKHGSRFN